MVEKQGPHQVLLVPLGSVEMPRQKRRPGDMKFFNEEICQNQNPCVG